MPPFYKPVSNKPNFNTIEQAIIQFWRQEQIFNKSIELRQDAPEFIFYEGPPTANGRPGVHHVLARTFKDLVCRYQTMQGKKVTRQAGWDEHGLPVEIEVQKQYDLKSKTDIEAMGVGKFNQYCATSTQKYINEWEALTERMAYWVDFKNAYRTSDPAYIERIWAILKKLYDKDLLYKGYKVVPWAPDSGTVVSQAEVALGYKDVIDETAYVKFKLTDEAAKRLKQKIGIDADELPVYIAAWTTTPWTLPSNMALAVGRDIEYAVCKKKDASAEYLVLSKKRWKAVLGEEWIEAGTFCNYFGEAEKEAGRYYTLFGDQVTTSEIIFGQDENGQSFVIDDESSGTGVVHLAPVFGEDDFKAYKAFQARAAQNPAEIQPLPEIRFLVEPTGVFNNNAPEFLRGQSLFNPAKDGSLQFNRINKIVIKHLEEAGLLLKTEKYEHSYPHNWRTNNPLIYYLRPSWYVATSQLKDALQKANEQINWYPEHIKEGRFGQWLAGNIDWSISRERYWGTPIPLWIGEKTGRVQAIGSFAELQEKLGTELPVSERPDGSKSFDPHKPLVDKLTWQEETDGILETFCRIPEVLDCWFDSGSMPYASASQPRGTADYICEAVDQTRGWFYTLLAVTVALEAAYEMPPAPPYKNVLCLGHILDKDGQKMSKSKGNTVDPLQLFEKFGADPVRWFMVSAVTAGNPIRFDESGVAEVMRRFVLPLWNTYSFYVLYANLDCIKPNSLALNQVSNLQAIDHWILARLKEAIKAVTAEYEAYDFSKATALIEKFVDDLSNVWVRANRNRFWNTSTEGAAVDLGAYATLTHCLLSLCKLCAPFNPMISEEIYQNLKASSACKSVHLEDWPTIEDLSPEEVELLQEMNAALEVINVGRALRQEFGIKIRQPLAKIVISSGFKVQRFAPFIMSELNIKQIEVAESEVKVSLDTQLTSELKAEGMAREFIHTVQGLRKNSGFDVSDRIKLYINFKGAETIAQMLREQRSYIMEEVLALTWSEDDPQESPKKALKLEGNTIEVAVEKLVRLEKT
jgi:isoleucyl-tRNA synthetase